MEDAWISGYANYKISGTVSTNGISKVSNLIDSSNRTWRVKLIQDTFSVENADRILQIPLATMEHDDMLVRKGESLGEFTETEALGNRSLTKHLSSSEWRPLENHMVPINFDAAFSQQHFRSTSGLVFRNERGEVIVSKSILTNRIASPFAAEAFACSQAVRLGMGVDAVEIERDALAVIKKCHSNVEDK
ncbi:hypothetical protein Gotri_011413 [Gossypium trilobum]|uniref:RNase H type-1 domain-containing protein n=1 Tax=Gossypium trilobum TaxID=34281 RepID=A0A7J9EUM2_9ROSI|nr:hypothetical protein [Gossypium trilobum]